MNQLTFLEAAATASVPRLPIEERYRLWAARQSGIYCEVVMEVERVVAGGRSPVDLQAVFLTLREQPDLAKSFGSSADFDMGFSAPMAEMLTKSGDVKKGDLANV